MVNCPIGRVAARVCVIVFAFALPAPTIGHVIQAADTSIPVELVNNARTDAETAWMVTGIIFIVLFALAVIICIYLWHLRNGKMKELRQLQNAHTTGKDNQNVWYGGANI